MSGQYSVNIGQSVEQIGGLVVLRLDRIMSTNSTPSSRLSASSEEAMTASKAAALASI
jgi:hypothetical protein